MRGLNVNMRSKAHLRSIPSPNLFPRERDKKRLFAPLLVGTSLLLTGCGSKPMAANIKLREDVQNLQARVDQLESQHRSDLKTIAALQPTSTTKPELSGAQADALYTTHGIRLGKITGGADFDPNSPGDEGLKVYVTPYDDDGDAFKAAGAITVEAFDLSAEKPQIGKWSFSAAEAKKLWNGQALLYEFVIPCPWQTRPQHEDVTVKVTFTDSLTGRSFTEQKLVKVKLPTK